MSAAAERNLGEVLPAAVASGALIAQLVAGKATRDALFLSQYGLELLPAAMTGAAAVSALAVVGVSKVLSRFGPARVVPAAFALGGALFLFEWWLSVVNAPAAAVVVYLHTSLFFAATGSAFWSLVNERFDPHTAKRHVGTISSGGTIGGIAGGLLVWQASSYLSIPKTFVLLAAMNAVGLWGALRMAPPKPRARAAEEQASEGAIEAFRRTPYLQELAALVLASAIIQALLDWLLSAKATAAYGKGQELLGFFALFNMVVGVLSFASQTVLTRPLLERRGLGGTIKLQPIGIAAGVALALTVPGLATVIVARGVEAVSRTSLFRSAYELFYTPLPASKKRATKTLIDVAVDRLGTVLGSVALFGIAQLASPVAQTRAVLFGVLATAAAAWYISGRLQDGYVEALATSLKTGAVDLRDSDALDLTTRKTLAETTALLDRRTLLARIEELQRDKETRTATEAPSSTEPEPMPVSTMDVRFSALPIDLADPELRRAMAIRSDDVSAIKKALAAPLTPTLATLAVPLLANDAVARDVVRALRRVAPRVTGMLVDHLLDPAVDSRARRRLPRVLKACRTQRAVDGLVMALHDPLFEVRSQAALGLTDLAAFDEVSVDPRALFDAALYELNDGRSSWTPVPGEDGERRTTDRGLAHVFTLLGLAVEREPVSIAYRAIKAEDAALRGTALEYLDVVLPPDVREVLVPLLGSIAPEPRPRARTKNELSNALLASSASLPRPR